jgi:hypothetical protein
VALQYHLDLTTVTPTTSTTWELLTVFFAAIVLVIGQLLFGLLATIRLHRESQLVVDDRLQELASTIANRVGNAGEITFRSHVLKIAWMQI